MLWRLYAKVPVLSGRELVKILGKAGFVAKRQKGSHIIDVFARINELQATLPL